MATGVCAVVVVVAVVDRGGVAAVVVCVAAVVPRALNRPPSKRLGKSLPSSGPVLMLPANGCGS